MPEAEALSGQDVSNRKGCERAALVFLEEYDCRAVLIKGGHRDGDPDDLLAVGGADDSESAALSAYGSPLVSSMHLSQ